MELAIALPLNRRGLIREEFFSADLIICLWLPMLFCMILFVLAGGVVAWVGLAIFVVCLWLCYVWSVSIWLRRIPAVVVDPIAIDLQGTGPVPWGEIRAVVIDRRRLWLELNRDTAAFVAARAFPPWFTPAHENLLGAAAWIAPGHIHVPLRWVDATSEEIATHIRRFAPVPVRAATPTAANSH
jgi:hypothetical protein